MAAWLLAMGGLAAWQLPSAAVALEDPEAVARWQAWWLEEGATLASGAPLLRLSSCPCASGEPPALPAGVVVVRDRTPGPEALLFDAAGRLRYAGPLRDPAFCGGGTPLQAVATRLALDLPPLLIDAPCDCTRLARLPAPSMESSA